MQGATEASKPHPGRMYDYILGGTYNYEVDRAAADQFVKLVPSIPVAARLNRTFLKVAAARWDVENISHIIDLGSGLPPRDISTTTCQKRKSCSLTAILSPSSMGERSFWTVRAANISNWMSCRGHPCCLRWSGFSGPIDGSESDSWG